MFRQDRHEDDINHIKMTYVTKDELKELKEETSSGLEKLQKDVEEQKRALYLHFTMDDNLTLSEEVKKRYHSLYSGNFFERYIKGLWVAAEGLVYPAFDKNTCVVPTIKRNYTKY